MNFNPMDILKNASGIQAKMEEMKKSMESLSVSGYGGGDMVRVDMISCLNGLRPEKHELLRNSCLIL